MFSRAALSVRNTVVRRPLTRCMGDVAAHKPNMAELPVPGGSWAENYSKKQRSYNLQLLAGIVFTAATIAWAFDFSSKDDPNVCKGIHIVHDCSS